MRYTRYDIGRKHKKNILPLAGILIIITAIIIGSLISNFLLKNSKIIQNSTKATNEDVQKKNNSNEVNSSDIINFETIQCGIFNNKDNINSEKNALQDYGVCFTIDDTAGTRVFLGIYPQTSGDAISKTLSDKGIDNVKATFQISKKNLCDAEIAEIINANLQILNKLSEKDVKTVKTDDLKKWLSKLETVDKNSKNYSTLTELIDFTNKLQNELSKEKVADCYVILYNALKKISIVSS